MTSVPRLSIVVPVYCEGDHLADSLATIRRHVAELGQTYELVAVDDGSTDATWGVLTQLTHQWPELRTFRLARNFGKEFALLAGLEASRGEAVIVMDADLQHPPALIPELYRLWSEQGFDVVNAVKAARGDESWLKRRFAHLYYAMFSRLSGVSIGGSSDFKLLSRRVVDIYCQLPERSTFFRGLVTWMGFRQASVPFEVASRAGGSTRWSLVKLTVLAVDSMVSFSTIPLQIVTVLGMGFMLFAVVLGAQTLWLKLSGQAIGGFATVILLLLIIGSVLMIALGVIGQYVAKIFEEVKRRPRYIIGDRVDAQAAAPAIDRGRTDRTVPETGRET